ncbi:MAG: hypothetical protein R6V31_02670 [Halohasta sp.]
MGFQWLSANACPDCDIVPKANRYDDFGYPVCPNCGAVVRSTGDGDPATAHAQTD